MTLGRVLLVVLAALAIGRIGYDVWRDWQLDEPGFHAQDCWFSLHDGRKARCGTFTVPENRGDPDSRAIRLPVVVFEAAQPDPARPPILYLTGGPGAHAYLGEQDYIDGWWEEQERFPAGHDLIVMGQRGTGLKQADFDCEEFLPLEVSLAAHRRGAATPDQHAPLLKAAEACARRLRQAGVDLTAYNSEESAADAAELRLALGIDEWNLYGVSYGTRLALSVLRYRPEGVRSVILDSVFPPEASSLTDLATFYRQALWRMFGDCAADEDCTRQYGDLAAHYAHAVEKLRAAPMIFDLSQVDPDTDLVLSVDDKVFDDLLFDALYSGETRMDIPVILREAAGDDPGVLNARVREYLEYETYDSTAVSLSHICHDEVPFDGPSALAAAIAEAGPLAHLITETWDSYLCEVWPAGRADSIENTPVYSDVPALLLAGAYDPVTPATLARGAASHLPNGRVFELAGAGHGVLYESDCAPRLVAAFLANPAEPLTNACRPGQMIAGAE